MPNFPLDHVVITVGPSLDEAAETYRRLGFALTPRGYHTLGSINHLAIFDETYLELLGHPPEQDAARANLWAAPDGLTGLALRTKDAEALRQALQGLGAETSDAKDFSRPVTLSNGEVVQAAFRTFQYGESAIDNGRVFFCQHKTPEHVYRDDDRAHLNGVTGLLEVVVQAEQPSDFEREVHRIRDAGEALTGAPSVTLTTLTPKEAAQRFGPDTPSLEAKRQRQTALRFKVKDRAALANLLQSNGVSYTKLEDGALRVSPDQTYGVVIEFE